MMNVPRGTPSEAAAVRRAPALVVGAQVMCPTCLGSGGWGSGATAQRCEKCGGTGVIDIMARAVAQEDCPRCDGTGRAFGERCFHLLPPNTGVRP
jgi:DnaJ-class molecular chaperone